ncbi:hypothetical protein Y032_0097g2969 [Ancylostoma ceylanicum]|uniref:V-type proton ATPase subunit a n=2 Tax=Ancylostoma ceylanicum TaxID=53326 RepID=A0A016TJT0_9BILA|nr:hypothetical protein Y032_0097g2969 [Ancylostoma ceylanicum]
MGSIYRSEVMSRCQIFLQTDSAYQCVAELGELGLAQFLDLNEDMNSYQRKFVNEIRRCEEMERKLNFIEEEVTKDEVEIKDYDEHIPAPQPKNMTELEANFEKLEEELLSINSSSKQLIKNHVQLLEMKAVLEKVHLLLDESTRRDAAMSISEAARGEAGPFTIGIANDYDKEKREDNELKFVTGVINRKKVISFERFIWRFCRGKVFVRTADIGERTELFEAKKTDDKAVFILFFSGEQLRSRVQKICNGFHGVIYNCPENTKERAHLLDQINAQVADMQNVINKTLEYRRKIIFAASLSVKKWTIMLLKLKSIFHTLNMFSVDVTHKCLIAECWVPTVDLPLVKQALRKGTDQAGSPIQAVLNEMETHDMPPTHFKLNKFTQGFQNIVDAYGIANYREVNPAPWSIISFPFLFAVMFGDSGHGIIMFLAALAFVVFENKLISMKIKDEIFNTFFGGRYVVLLMGIFSIYTGLLYNDIYSKSIDIFGSSWKNPYPQSLLASMDEHGFNSSQTMDLTWPPEYSFDSNLGPYPFGVDPIWNVAKNKLNFLNPMKMKTSIILGISQMAFGLLLSLCNHIHNRSLVDIFFVFVPQCFFLGCIFVYLCVMVVLKWIFFYVNPTFIFGRLYPGSNCAPSLLIGLINMFMLKGRDPGFVQHINSPNATASVTIDGKNYTYDVYDQCYLQQWYPGQVLAEQILLGLAVVSIPIMLFVKPFYVRWLHNRGLPIPGGHGHGGGGEEEEFSFGDVMVYQAIHTIEFALGCISHTASYLRLWALSLAHAQLSEVLWDMLLSIGLDMGGWAGSAAVFILYFFFGVLSVSILILMEGLSAFLHALRLHWVEFNSKFYGGTGVAFEPFYFTRLIRIAEGLEQ